MRDLVELLVTKMICLPGVVGGGEGRERGRGKHLLTGACRGSLPSLGGAGHRAIGRLFVCLLSYALPGRVQREQLYRRSQRGRPADLLVSKVDNCCRFLG